MDAHGDMGEDNTKAGVLNKEDSVEGAWTNQSTFDVDAQRSSTLDDKPQTLILVHLMLCFWN